MERGIRDILTGKWIDGHHYSTRTLPQSQLLQVANDPKLRERFALDAAQFALRHNFDGIDLDWEYPGQRGGNPHTDKDAFVLLLKDLHRELAKHNLLLTAAFAVTKSAATVSYDIPEVVK